jgi:cell division protein ZapE
MQSQASNIAVQREYRELVSAGDIEYDAAQEEAVRQLQHLYDHISRPDFFDEKHIKGGFLRSFFRRNTRPDHPGGIYIWGKVGRGKSMIMDLFYSSLPLKKKKRVHFHTFMLDVHRRVHELRKQETTKDPLLIVACDIAEKYDVLCFDEMQVHDITDAMILARLFTVLFNQGTVVLFTSNRPPESLYLHGLQRERFLPFIQLINERLQIAELNAKEDYRTGQLASLNRVYYFPLDEDADAFLDASFQQLCSGMKPQTQTVEVQGRELAVKIACRDVAVFDFSELCGQPLAALDYLALVAVFRTFLVRNIPQMNKEKRNEAKRFVTLVDVLYEQNAKLICTAEVPPQQLYVEGEGSFEFERTVSRLLEMQSKRYLAASHPE